LITRMDGKNAEEKKEKKRRKKKTN
jgi:hypothetical protein